MWPFLNLFGVAARKSHVFLPPNRYARQRPSRPPGLSPMLGRRRGRAGTASPRAGGGAGMGAATLTMACVLLAANAPSADTFYIGQRNFLIPIGIVDPS